MDAGVANISSHESVKNSIINATPADCYQCPFGGICTKGLIKAKSNFWRYTYNDRAYFLSCPIHYCKGADKVRTPGNYSCIKTRTGTLCGACREDFTENLFTSTCILTELCKPHWFWLLLLSFGLSYLFFLMFLPEISQFFKRLLRFSFNFSRKRDTSLVSSLLFANKEQENLDSSDQFERVNAASIVGQNSAGGPNNSVVGGLLKILAFYYQVDVLFNFYERKTMDNMLLSIKEALFSIFNLSPIGSNLSAVGCPFRSLNVVNKFFLRAALPLVIFVLAGVIYCINVAVRYVRRWSVLHLDISKKQSFQARLSCSILQIIILSYSAVTYNLFSLVTCVSLEDGRKILFVDGNISCYRWWQFILFAFIAIWVFPLGISLITATKRLKMKQISVKEFFLSLIIPLPMNIVFIIRHFLYRSFQEKDKNNAEKSDNGFAENSDNTAEKLLFILQGPFKRSKRKASRLYWDAVLIFQRLILLIMHALVIDPIGKALLMSVTMIIFLGHHLRVLPFQSSILNMMQSVALFFICVDSVINMFDAYTYVHGTHITGPLATISEQVFGIIVTIMHLFFPVFITLVIICIIIIRLLDLIIYGVRSLKAHYNNGNEESSYLTVN